MDASIPSTPAIPAENLLLAEISAAARGGAKPRPNACIMSAFAKAALLAPIPSAASLVSLVAAAVVVAWYVGLGNEMEMAVRMSHPFLLMQPLQSPHVFLRLPNPGDFDWLTVDDPASKVVLEVLSPVATAATGVSAAAVASAASPTSACQSGSFCFV